MLDIFKGFLALYMVDVAGVSESRAALTIAVWVVVGLIGDLLLIPLLERMRGLTYLEFSVIAVLALYPAFLLAPSFEMKLISRGCWGSRMPGGTRSFRGMPIRRCQGEAARSWRSGTSSGFSLP